MEKELSSRAHLEAQIANDLAILARLLRGGGGCELDVFDAEGVQRLGYLDFGLCVEECVRKLPDDGQHPASSTNSCVVMLLTCSPSRNVLSMICSAVS